VDSASLAKRLMAIPGVGPWTVAEVTRLVFGDADAVSVGDYHMKNIISWALAGEPRGTDERMLELLEPYRGHRGRVCVMIETAGIGAPRFGPRVALRDFRSF
jgi:3-methyladenine DNA glycosylase/8-oxoguanine DNA glycosylase